MCRRQGHKPIRARTSGRSAQVHVKSRRSRFWRSLLVARHTVLNEMRAIGNVVRAILREGGIKLGTPALAAFAGRMQELAGDDPLILPLVTPVLAILATMLEQLDPLTRQVLVIVRGEVVCRQLTSVPGVDPITALACPRHHRPAGAVPALPGRNTTSALIKRMSYRQARAAHERSPNPPSRRDHPDSV